MSKRKVHRCRDCGKSEGLNKHNRVCPSCGGTVEEVGAAKAKQDTNKQEELSVDAQAVVDVLAGITGVTRKDARQAVVQIVRRGTDAAVLRRVAEEVARRCEKATIDRPLGLLVTMARQANTPTTAVARRHATPVDGWQTLTALKPEGERRPMPTLKTALADLATPASVVLPPQVPNVPISKRWASIGGRPGESPLALFERLKHQAVEEGKTVGDLLPEVERPEETYTCETCKDAGFFSKPWAGPPEPWPELKRCPACDERESPARFARMLRASGLDDAPLFRLADLLPVPGLEPAVEAAVAFAKGEVEQVVLVGDVGRGKTHLAIGALYRCIEEGTPGYYLNMGRFLDQLRGTYDEKSQETFDGMMALVQAMPVLVIDDLGAEKPTEWAVEKVFALVDARWSCGLRTMACTNDPPESWDRRVLSRLCDRNRGYVVLIPDTVPDFRLGERR